MPGGKGGEGGFGAGAIKGNGGLGFVVIRRDCDAIFCCGALLLDAVCEAAPEELDHRVGPIQDPKVAVLGQHLGSEGDSEGVRETETDAERERRRGRG